MIDFSEDMKKICNLPIKERHSYFQLQHFVIGKEPTIQSRLWRCVRELKDRKAALLAMQMEIEEINDDVEIIDIHIQEKKTKERTKITEIEIRKLERQKKSKELRLIDIKENQKVVEEEAVFLIKAFRALSDKEKLKPFDDADSQKQYWNEKLAQDFNLRNKFHLPPDMELIKTILAMNSDSIVKQDLIEMLNNVEKFQEPTFAEELLLKKAKEITEFSSREDLNKDKNDI